MKKAVITGISRGIGLAIASLLLEKKWQVIGTSTNGKCPLMHPDLLSVKCDLSSSDDINIFVRNLPFIDLLINNAAVLIEPWDEAKINLSQLRKTFEINVFGTLDLTEQCLAKLKPHAQIINISSGWGAFSSNDSPFQPHYKMSKACLNMYTKLLAARLPMISVSSFDPGWVQTDMGTTQATKLPTDAAQEIYDLISNSEKPSGLFWTDGKTRDW